MIAFQLLPSVVMSLLSVRFCFRADIRPLGTTQKPVEYLRQQ
jgi:hypothetical protein